jgi:hypothetical protein
MTSTSTIILQQATADDDAALRTVAQLDSARAVARPALMAIVDDRLIAVASLADGRVVADPFAETQQAVRLLRLRCAELAGGDDRPRVRGARRLPPLRARAAV